MYRGTTPTHTFVLPFDADLVEKVMIIYGQNDAEVFRKETDDCKMEGNQISVTLSQEETFKLSHSSKVQVQIRILTVGGDAMASEVFVRRVGMCLNDEEI